MTALCGNMDPRIGVLMRQGKHVFYAYTQGYSLPPFEGGLGEVQRALMGAAASSEATGAHSGPPRSAEQARLRRYVVEVIPRMTVYAGTSTYGPYEVEVTARTSREACSKVRADRRREDGRFVVPASFRGRRLTD